MYSEKIGICESINSSSTSRILKEWPKAMGVEGEAKIDREILDGYALPYVGWFKGLSHIFLNIHIPKILLTAEK